jgi:H+/Cl- antiporter ClcA
MAVNASMPDDPLAVLHSRRYLGLLFIAAVLGVPISAAAYYFLWAINQGHLWLFETLPTALGFDTVPSWWPLPLLAVGGLIAGAAIEYLPGGGGHSPLDGFHAGAPPTVAELAGILLAALASLCFGAVVGPEGPLIALGSGLAAVALRLIAPDASDRAVIVVGAAGAFAAIAFLLGSPMVGAFLMLEAVGLAGPKSRVVMIPGLLCSGIGFLIAVGLNSWTGLGRASLAIAGVPDFAHLDGVEFLWAIAFGAGAAVLGSLIRRLGVLVRPHIERRPTLTTPLAGLLLAAMAVVYCQITGGPTSDILFSGEASLPTLVQRAGTYTVGTLALLIVCKSLAYGISLGSFRGGPVFPAIFIGGAAGVLFSHFPGLPVIAGVAMGMGAMAAVMLRMPMTAVLLASLLLGQEGITAMPLVIVAVVVAYVATAWLASSSLLPYQERKPGQTSTDSAAARSAEKLNPGC